MLQNYRGKWKRIGKSKMSFNSIKLLWLNTLLYCFSYIKVIPDLRGCPRGKNSYARHFKGKHGKLYIVGKLNKCRFRKKNINCWFLQFRKRKSQSTAKMTMCHSIELIGYQIQAHWQNNCTVLITKDQSSKVCQHFSIF